MVCIILHFLEILKPPFPINISVPELTLESRETSKLCGVSTFEVEVLRQSSYVHILEFLKITCLSLQK